MWLYLFLSVIFFTLILGVIMFILETKSEKNNLDESTFIMFRELLLEEILKADGGMISLQRDFENELREKLCKKYIDHYKKDGTPVPNQSCVDICMSIYKANKFNWEAAIINNYNSWEVERENRNS